MASTGKQRRYLRGLAHSLRPIVQIGRNGVTGAVIRQVDSALGERELIKVKLGAECPTSRQSAGAELVARTGCELAGTVGRVLILYRPHPEEPRIVLPGPNELSVEETTNGGL